MVSDCVGMHIQVLAQTVASASVIEWAKLDLEPEARVLRQTRVRYNDSRPISFEEVVLALDRFPGLDINGGVTGDLVALAKAHGVSLGNARERMTVLAATETKALHLGIAPMTKILMLDRLVVTANGQPLEWCVSFTRFPAE